MPTHSQRMRYPMTRKHAPRTQAHSGVALFIVTLTILIALIALAPLTGAGQSPHPASRLQAKGSVSRVSQPSSPLFLPAVAYASGGYDLSVAVADVNGDGKLDLVVSDYNTGVDVLLGNGDGTFQPAVTYNASGYSAWSVAVADVNGDGKPDIAVATFYANNIAVLLGNGDGTFQPAVTYPSGGSGGGTCPDSVAIADVNGDAKPDLVVTNWCGQSYLSQQLDVLLGNGDGTFQPAVSYSSGGQVPESVVVADVNGDGKPDLLVANLWQSFQHTQNGSVGVLLGNGDGTFQPPVIYGSGGYGAASVAVADVNRDGKPDLVVANCEASPGSGVCTSVGAGHGLAAVLLGNGDGTFQPAVTYDLGGLGAGSVVVADVNGDGKPDVLVVSCASSICTSSVGVLLGNGDGTFQSVASYGSGGYGAASVAVADVNGDRKPDLLVATCTNSSCSLGSVGVLLNNTGVKSSTSTTLTSGLNPSIYGRKVTWTATVTSSGSIKPTGNVRFTWSGYTIGSATLNSSGVATLTRSNLNADSYPLTAVYAGDAAHLGSTSAVLNQVVLETTSAATLSSSPNLSTQGQAVTFTAKISSPTVMPTGPVTFTSGKTVLGTAQLSGGKAKLAVSSLPVGSTKVTVTYYGDSNIAKSSASVIQTVH